MSQKHRQGGAGYALESELGGCKVRITLEEYVMDTEKFWSTTEMNKFLYQQLKAMCEAEGFVLSPRRGKRMVRIAEHYTEVVYPEIVYSRTVVHALLFSTSSSAYHSYASKKIHLHRSNDKNVFINSYDELAVEDPTSYKQFFNIEQMKTVWAEVIEPQLNREIFSCLNDFHYDHFLILSDKQKCGSFHYDTSPGNHDAPRFFALGCGEFLSGNLEKSIPLLEEALIRYKKSIEQSKQVGHEVIPYKLEDCNAVTKLLSVLRESGAGGKDQVLNMLQSLEQTVLNKTWGVTLSPEGKTIRLKKKELL